MSAYLCENFFVLTAQYEMESKHKPVIQDPEQRK